LTSRLSAVSGAEEDVEELAEEAADAGAGTSVPADFEPFILPSSIAPKPQITNENVAIVTHFQWNRECSTCE